MSKSLDDIVMVRARQHGEDVHDVPDNVLVVQLLQQADLANGSGGHALVFGLEPNLLQRDDLIRADIAGLVDDTVCA
jgi:hypothetical protein